MKASLELKMDNAAFEDCGHGAELARILRKLAKQVETWPGAQGFSLLALDINGNRIGLFQVLS
jgi:hypothetical protein